ncbi:MAG: 50S ribosomal protein L4 [Candidatus Pacearchaeota archaeon]
MKSKTEVIGINGKKTKEISLPSVFSKPIRNDIVSKVLEAEKSMQPYSPSPTGGKQHSASGKIIHRRHVWKSGYGRGMSRIPRKIHSRRGSQFNWVGAEVASTRGGRRAHPPKSISMINTKKINKKEMNLALISAISSTANKKEVALKYGNIDEKELRNLPIVIDSKLVSLKTKDFLLNVKKILGENIFSNLSRKRKVRSGRGKMRGRKYKKNAGLLLVTGNDEKFKSNAIDSRNINTVNVVDLAKGGPGRLTLYTEKAIGDLEERFNKDKSGKNKK